MCHSMVWFCHIHESVVTSCRSGGCGRNVLDGRDTGSHRHEDTGAWSCRVSAHRYRLWHFHPLGLLQAKMAHGEMDAHPVHDSFRHVLHGTIGKENVLIGKAIMEGNSDAAQYWHNVSANAYAGVAARQGEKLTPLVYVDGNKYCIELRCERGTCTVIAFE